jgi:hypothetical protein
MSEERSVFIPWLEQDLERCEALAKEFRLRGAPALVEVVSDSDLGISAAQRAATLIWIGWTAASVQSSCIQADAGEARDRGALYQALLDPVSAPEAFRLWPLFDLRDFNGAPHHEAMADMTERMRHRLSPPDLQTWVTPYSSSIGLRFPAMIPQRDSVLDLRQPKAVNAPSLWVIAASVALAIVGLTLFADFFGLTAGERTRWRPHMEALPPAAGANP